MTEFLFKKICEDVLDYIKEYQDDFMIDSLKMLEKLNGDDNYHEIKEEILSIFSQTFHGYEDNAENLYGSLNLDFYLNTFNKEFYKYLADVLKKEKNKTCKSYANHIESILNSSYIEQSAKDISNVLKKANSKSVEIKYKDNSNNVTNRIISNIVIEKTKITAFCHLRNENREFKIKSIVEAKLIK